MSQLMPAYAREGREVGVIHFGLGAFHRGHQAVYFDHALRQGLGEWGIFGISPRSSSVTDALRKQGFCYTVNARTGTIQEPIIISSIFDGGIYERDNPLLQKAIASPELKLITVTVTEKAYVAGLHGDSMPNRILEMLHMRFSKGLDAPTIISCDNLPRNGEYLRSVLIESAAIRNLGSEFQKWLLEVQTPNSMVDRIVPAITKEAIDRFEVDFGYRDESLISTEPFRQWVVAPHVGNYDLTKIGIEVSPEVEKFETLKLRLFNGAHSTTAYFSQLSNIEYVYEAMAIPEWSSFTEGLQTQLSSSFQAPISVNPALYSANARARIGNSSLAHRSAQIAMDGSAKLPQRLFRAMNTLNEAGEAREKIAFALALWISFLRSGLPVTDPLAEHLIERARSSNPVEAVAQVMQTPGLQDPIPESDWSEIARFVGALEIHSPIDCAKNL